MKAIILAAGRGSRMKDLTEDKPKCFVELSGKRLFDWQVSSIKEAGIKDIVIVCGYKKEAFNSGDYLKEENPRWSETNMVVTLTYARKYLLQEECIVSYADIVYHPAIIKKLIDAEGDIVITYDRLWQSLWKTRMEDPLADAETFKTDERGVLKEIGNKTSSIDDVKGQYMGLFKFNPDGWKKVESMIANLSQEKRDKLDVTSLFKMMIDSGIDIGTVPVDGKWCEVDTEDDLRTYANVINEVNSGALQWEHDWRW